MANTAPIPAANPFRQKTTSLSMSPKTIERVKAAMVLNKEESFSRAVDDILREAFVLGVPYFKDAK